MPIELITRRPPLRDPSRPPLLFVHGAMHGAWCWDEYFLPWFAARGWEAHALSLRGHGASAGHEQLKTWRLRDYVDDVLASFDDLSQPPVLIGHSMGGSIVTKVAAQRAVPGLVLIDTAPIRPVLHELMAQHLRQHPVRMLLASLTGDFRFALPVFGKVFFSPEIPATERKRHLSRMGPESPLALADALGGEDPTDYSAPRAPSLVISAVRTGNTGVNDHLEIASLLGGEHTTCDGAHDLMLDVKWEAAAEAIEAWLRRTPLNATQPARCPATPAP